MYDEATPLLNRLATPPMTLKQVLGKVDQVTIGVAIYAPIVQLYNSVKTN